MTKNDVDKPLSVHVNKVMNFVDKEDMRVLPFTKYQKFDITKGRMLII